jgi:hypothetical protein
MSDKVLFQTTDPQGRVIEMSESTWLIHKKKHREIKSFQEIKHTINKPDFITENTERKTLAYSKISSLRLYLNVYVGIESDTSLGHVRTAFVQNTMPKGNVIWSQKK